MKNLKINKIMWFLVVLMSLVASLVGVFNQNIYTKVVSNEIMPGVLAQDLFTIVLSIITLIFIFTIKENDIKKQIVIMGIISYLFYGYGIYAIERLYTVLYLLYMAIFGLSLYTLVFGIVSINKKILREIRLPKLMKNISIGFLLFIPLLFYPLWISQIIKLIQTGQKLEFTYAVFILDLCFVMPMFIIIAIMVVKNIDLGLLLAPALLIKGFTVLFPVGLGEFFKQSVDIGEASFYIGFSMVFLILTVFYLRNLKTNTENSLS